MYVGALSLSLSLFLSRQAYLCGNVLAPAVSLADPLLESACACSGQRGGAWAHDCAVWDEEVAEDQDESGGHGRYCGRRKFPKRDVE